MSPSDIPVRNPAVSSNAGNAPVQFGLFDKVGKMFKKQQGYQHLEDDEDHGQSDFAQAVTREKFGGRQAEASRAELAQTRSGDVARGVGKMAVAGSKVAADAVAPGTSRIIQGAQVAHGVHRERYLGGSGMGAIAEEGGGEALSAIPVVGDAVGFMDGAKDTGKALFQGSKSRTREKVLAAKSGAKEARARQDAISDLEEQLAEKGGAKKEQHARQLRKARQRNAALESGAEKKLQSKRDRQTMPLLLDTSDSESDD